MILVKYSKIFSFLAFLTYLTRNLTKYKGLLAWLSFGPLQGRLKSQYKKIFIINLTKLTQLEREASLEVILVFL